MIPTKLFQSTTPEEKVEFFVHCQELLVTHHPDSPFITREDNIEERLDYARELITKYQGMVYMDDNICVLFNKVNVTEHDPVTILKENQFKPPQDTFNAVTIDFVAFRALKDCLNWVQNQYDPRVKYVIYVKNGKPQIFKTEDLIAKVFKIPKLK